MTNNSQGQSPKPNTPPSDYQDLVRKIADRVWQIWQDELRQEQQRGTSQQQRRK